jgi:hypothetical protein
MSGCEHQQLLLRVSSEHTHKSLQVPCSLVCVVSSWLYTATQLSDYGLVADLFTALPELEHEIARVKGASGGASAA